MATRRARGWPTRARVWQVAVIATTSAHTHRSSQQARRSPGASSRRRPVRAMPDARRRLICSHAAPSTTAAGRADGVSAAECRGDGHVAQEPLARAARPVGCPLDRARTTVNTPPCSRQTSALSVATSRFAHAALESTILTIPSAWQAPATVSKPACFSRHAATSILETGLPRLSPPHIGPPSRLDSPTSTPLSKPAVVQRTLVMFTTYD